MVSELGRNDFIHRELLKLLASLSDKTDYEIGQALQREANDLNKGLPNPLSEREVRAIVKSVTLASHNRVRPVKVPLIIESHSGCIVWATQKASKKTGRSYIIFMFKSMSTGTEFVAVHFKPVDVKIFTSSVVKLYKFKVSKSPEGKKSYVLQEYN